MVKVSVVIPCFNAEAFISDSIQSVLAQTESAIECIVVDDASKDGSRVVIKEWADRDSRIVPVFQPVNGGPSRARNAGVAQAQGKWVTFLDADDLYDPRRIEVLLEAVDTVGQQNNSPEVHGVVDNQSVRQFPDGSHLFSGFEFLVDRKPAVIPSDLFFTEQAKLNHYLRPGYMKAMLHREWLLKTGISFPVGVSVGEDFVFYGKLFGAGMHCLGINYDGYIYRRRESSLSQSVDLIGLSTLFSAFVDEHEGMLPRSAAKALRERAVMMRRIATLKEVFKAMKSLKPWSATKALSTRPDCLLVVGPIAKRKVEGFVQKYSS